MIRIFIVKQSRMFFCFACLLPILLSTSALSQSKRAAIWHVGNKRLDFNTKPITVTDIHNEDFYGEIGSASLCDKNGNMLLFASLQSNKIYNKNYNTLSDGDDIYLPKTNSMFVPMPGNDSLIYLISAHTYSVINIKNETVIKNNIVWNDDPKIDSINSYANTFEALYHSNCNDIWIVSREKNGLFSRLIASTGFSNGYIKLFNKRIDNHKLSPTGKYLCFTYFNNKADNDNNTLNISFGYFNRATCTIAGIKNYTLTNSQLCQAVEFSPDESKLYLNIKTNKHYILYQINIINGILDFNNRVELFKETIGSVSANNHYSSMSLGIDGKIYKTFFLGKRRIDIIHNPNAEGAACNFQANAIELNTGGNILPSFIRTWQSANTCELSFYSQNFCFGDNTMFNIKNIENIKSVLWNFGDGSSSTELSPEHYYSAEGEYIVTLQTTFNNESITTEKQTINITYFNQLKIN